jgi:hypothetical protein
VTRIAVCHGIVQNNHRPVTNEAGGLMTGDFILIAWPPITPSNLDNKCIS